MILYTGDGCLNESLEFYKGSQATCSVWCGLRDIYRDNARDIDLISICFGVHRAILHAWGDISVLLVLWQCSWGFSGVQSSRSRLLTCLIRKTEMLCTQCREPALISWRGGSLMGFLELRQELGVYSPVKTGMYIRNWSLFSEVRTPV